MMTDIHSCSYHCDRPECIKAQRDELRDKLAQPERHDLQAKGEHPAPCARHCEATAFQIVINNLKAQLAQPEQSVAGYCKKIEELIAERDELRSRLAQPEPEQEPCGWQFYAAGKWHNGMEANDHRVNTEAAGIPTRNVYPGPVAQPEQEPTSERAWFTIAELNAWADKKLSENPHWVMPKDKPERDEPPPQRKPEQEPVAWLDGPHLVVRLDMRNRLNYQGPWVDLGRAIPDKWIPFLFTAPPQRKGQA